MLMNTNDDLCIRWPPRQPKSGDVFLYAYRENGRRLDFVADGMNWRHQGTRVDSKRELLMKKRYWKRRIGHESVNFKKCAFEISTIKRILIHYMGERDEEVKEAPHGNRKKSIQQSYVRSMPSVLHNCNKSNADISPSPASISNVSKPRNMKQILNRKHIDKRNSVIEAADISEIDSILDINTELVGFIKFMSIAPFVNCVMINEAVLQDFAEFVGSEQQCYISCINRLKFKDYTVTCLFGRYHQFEDEPGVPLAYSMHNRQSTDTYKDFFREVLKLAPELNADNVIMITEKDKYLQEACSLFLPLSRCFISWESLKKFTNNLLKRVKSVSSQKKKEHAEDVNALLMSISESEYSTSLEACKYNWPEEFSRSFDANLNQDVFM